MALDLDLEDLRRRQKEAASKRGGGSFWRPKKGDQNLVRFYLFQHTVTKEDVKEGLFHKTALGKKVTRLDRPLLVQYRDGKVHLADSKGIALYESLREEDEEAARKIRPVEKHLLNLVDLTEKPYRIRFWLAPSSVWDSLVDSLQELEPEELFGSKGRDVRILFDATAAPAKMYKLVIRDASKSSALPEDLTSKVFDFYSPEVLSMVLGNSESKGETKAAEPKTGKKALVEKEEEETTSEDETDEVEETETETEGGDSDEDEVDNLFAD